MFNTKFFFKKPTGNDFLLGTAIGLSTDGTEEIIMLVEHIDGSYTHYKVSPDEVYKQLKIENIKVGMLVKDLNSGYEYKVLLIDYDRNLATLKNMSNDVSDVYLRLEQSLIDDKRIISAETDNETKLRDSLDLEGLFTFLVKSRRVENLPVNPAIIAIKRLQKFQEAAERIELEASIILKDIVRSYNLTKKIPSKLNIGSLEIVYLDSWNEVFEALLKMEREHNTKYRRFDDNQ